MFRARILVLTVVASGLVAACCSPRHDEERADRTTNAVAPGGIVEVGNFDSVELNGGGHVTLRYGATEKVTLIKGSTQYTRFRVEEGHKLIIDACHDDCPSLYDLEIEIVMPSVSAAAVNGGGKIEAVQGFPTQAEITAAVNGGGVIDLRALDAKDGTAAVNGGGKIRLRADAKLTAAVEGGGDIRYVGHPDVTSAINGGGDVSAEGD